MSEPSHLDDHPNASANASANANANASATPPHIDTSLARRGSTAPLSSVSLIQTLSPIPENGYLPQPQPLLATQPLDRSFNPYGAMDPGAPGAGPGYGFYAPPIIENGFASTQPLSVGVGGFGYATQDLAAAIQNQYDYGDTDPYGALSPGLGYGGLPPLGPQVGGVGGVGGVASGAGGETHTPAGLQSPVHLPTSPIAYRSPPPPRMNRPSHEPRALQAGRVVYRPPHCGGSWRDQQPPSQGQGQGLGQDQVSSPRGIAGRAERGWRQSGNTQSGNGNGNGYGSGNRQGQKQGYNGSSGRHGRQGSAGGQLPQQQVQQQGGQEPSLNAQAGQMYFGQYWSGGNGAYPSERGKKDQGRPANGYTPPHSGSNTPLRHASAFGPFATSTPPQYGGASSMFGQFTPNTPTHPHPPHHQLQQVAVAPQPYGVLPHHQGQPYGLHTPHSPVNYRRERAKRFDELPRSAVLEDYRLNKVERRWTVDEIMGHIIEFSGDQHGSRLVQTKIETSSKEDKQRIYEEILSNAHHLMTDVFGNYVIQKLFEHGEVDQVRGIAGKMKGIVLNLSMQMYGCRVVQRALDSLSHLGMRDLLEGIVFELKDHLIDCVKSANANHVVQRVVYHNPPKYVVDAFVGHVEELSLHAYGCRVLQKAFEHVDPEFKRDLLVELHASARLLIEDQYGNYVVQSVITSCEPADRDKVIDIIKGQVWYLSRHKFASNVVEKAVLHANADDRRELAYELVNIREDGNNRVLAVLRDPFANFVFQTCLTHAERSQRQQLLDLVSPIFNQIRHTPVGKKLEHKITEMQADGFNVTLPSFDLSLVKSLSNHTNTLSLSDSAHTDPSPSASASASASASLSRSGSGSMLGSATMITPPEGERGVGGYALGNRSLRPTASAPPMSVFGQYADMGLGRIAEDANGNGQGGKGNESGGDDAVHALADKLKAQKI